MDRMPHTSAARTLRLGTRGSPLALYQARAVARLLEARTATACDIVVIKTSGDRLSESPLAEAGGKRLFVKEIEDALLSGDIDLAVHSSKDMPAALPDGLAIAAVLPREDPRDVLVLPSSHAADQPPEAVRRTLGTRPRIGTSSVRRSAQLKSFFGEPSFAPVRGNLDTRLRKLDAGDYDALVLAAAGLRRLDRAARITAFLPVESCLPAPGQGIIAVEIGTGGRDVAAIVGAIDDAAASLALRAERAVVERLGGGCQMPLGAYARSNGDQLLVTGIVVSPDGSRVVRADASGPPESPEDVGVRAADELLARGADVILEEVRRAPPVIEGHQP